MSAANPEVKPSDSVDDFDDLVEQYATVLDVKQVPVPTPAPPAVETADEKDEKKQPEPATPKIEKTPKSDPKQTQTPAPKQPPTGPQQEATSKPVSAVASAPTVQKDPVAPSEQAKEVDTLPAATVEVNNNQVEPVRPAEAINSEATAAAAHQEAPPEISEKPVSEKAPEPVKHSVSLPEPSTEDMTSEEVRQLDSYMSDLMSFKHVHYKTANARMLVKGQHGLMNKITDMRRDFERMERDVFRVLETLDMRKKYPGAFPQANVEPPEPNEQEIENMEFFRIPGKENEDSLTSPGFRSKKTRFLEEEKDVKMKSLLYKA